MCALYIGTNCNNYNVRRAPHKLVVTVRCTSVTCPKFYSDNMESPTLVVVAYVVQASCARNFTVTTRKTPHWSLYECQACPKFTVPKWKAPHVKKHVRPMLPLIPEKSDLKGDENGKFWRRFAHTPWHTTNGTTAWD